MLCKTSEETLSHFLLECTTIASNRQPILRDIKHILRDSNIDITDRDTLVHLKIDCSGIVDTKTVCEIIFYFRRSFFPSAVRLWNSLSASTISAPTMDDFKILINAGIPRPLL